ncbi:MAG: leucine--tRNA ligase [Candidatus Lokiarchaeota archaeon]|nr:leucine--tRNA ligase [Candidatus Lokiarchaeota archaeon]
MVEYDPRKIEEKWQSKWEKDKIFKVRKNKNKKKYYVLEMYPYPSGKLHMGHLRNYTIGDCVARYKRMNGFNVLYPMGYDSFGMPAENAAIDHGTNPEEWTDKNIETMQGQQKRIGLSYDWSRMVYSHDPHYYKYDQWFFLKMHEKGLAYKQESYVNWCPKCATVLANEQAQGGKCWRCNSIVDQKFLTQWFLKIRDYAEELLKGLDSVDWPDKVKIMQKNWIGRSEGSIIKFPIVGEKRTIDIFTTRPDTIFGVTFMVFAPEHPWIRKWVKGTEYQEKFERFYEEVMRQNKFERTDADIEKKGMFVGKYAINPMTDEKVPIYIGNFVIYEYGAGAVMAVPGHDQRDFEFAREYDIPIKVVIQPPDYEINPEKMSRAYVADGVLVNSGDFDGIDNQNAMGAITNKLAQKGTGQATINYKLRDWGISRQRYWGCPIPIIYCDKCGTVPVPYEDLPVQLPKDVSFTGSGNPLETSKAYLNVKCPRCGNKARRETDTMDTFVDSSWYFFAFCDPRSKDVPFRKDQVDYWGNVDQYIGGIEHAVLHLIYARFWTKVGRDLGLHSHDEPFQRLLTQGMINKSHPYCEKCDRFAMKAEMNDKKCKLCNSDYALKSVKMSKSYGNTVDPTTIMNQYGADAARFFILFGASPESGLEWSDEGVTFASKFVKKIFKLLTEAPTRVKEKITTRDVLIDYHLNKTIKEVSRDLETITIRNSVNTIVQFSSELEKYKKEGVVTEIFERSANQLVKILHPIAPHLTEEIWESMGNEDYLSLQSWPLPDEKVLTEENEHKWIFMNSLFEDINHIMLMLKREKIEKITIIIAAKWKFEMYPKMMQLIDKTKNQGEIIKTLMNDSKLKPQGKIISQIVGKILKGIGKYPKYSMTQENEKNFYDEIKPIIGKKYDCKAEMLIEENAKGIDKAVQALPGKPVIIIE